MTGDAAVSICSRGGSLRDDTHTLLCYQEQGGLLLPQRLPTTTLPRASARGVGPYPGLDDNDDDAMSSSSAPVLEGARNCGSSQMQELVHDGRRHREHLLVGWIPIPALTTTTTTRGF